MKCPNCKQPFADERAGKFFCSTCGWLEKIDKEWKSCEAPPPGESPAPQEPEPEPEPTPEPSPAALEPSPAALEPDPAANEPSPDHVKKYLGGLITITEVDE
ncbi:hypothetical protein ES703_41569 [subsurface metagenome]